MGLQCGIVGLPNVGKSTLFNALTAAGIAAENYPFCTIEPNSGIVVVPDARLQALDDIVHSKQVVPATVEFVDIAGLVRGASEGEGLGNQFLGHIRETDAIAQVVRCFEDENVTHVDGAPDPLRDIETIETELGLADLVSVEKRLDRVQRQEAKSGDKEAKAQAEMFDALLAQLSAGEPARSSFFTAVEKEVKAWTIYRGTTAPQAAGEIHSDFERGFIRAEIIGFDDYIATGGETEAKSRGVMRVEGKGYVVKDGDVAHFRVGV